MSVPSSLIKKYVTYNVPQEDLQHAMHKWIKRYWRALSAKGRTQLRIDLRNNQPIFANIPVVVRSADGAVMLDWSKPGREANKKKHGRRLYWKKTPSIKKKEEEAPAEAIPVGKKVLATKSTKKKTKTISAKKKTSSKK